MKEKTLCQRASHSNIRKTCSLTCLQPGRLKFNRQTFINSVYTITEQACLRSEECRQLLKKAGDLVEVNVMEDPRYRVADDQLA